MATCQDTANIAGKVSLFLGVDTASWSLQQFIDAATFAKKHGITSLFVKVSEVGSAPGSYWYGGIDKFDVIYQSMQKIINVIPYAFVYGDYFNNLPEEITIAESFLKKYGKYCLDMEQTYWAQPASANWAKQFNDALLPIPGYLWVSCPADPIENNQLPFLQAIDQSANALMPMAYSDYLSSKYPGDFIGLGCLQPTFDLSQEFGANDIVKNIQAAKDKGILAISLWYYGFAQQNTALLDKCVQTFTGVNKAVKHWYEYDIVVPFGNPNFDSALGGSHDMDLGAPPNCPVTALLSGTVSSVSSPAWGKQVGIQLDIPYNGKQYCAYLHLSAVNPSLKVGSHVKVGDIIGWTGGGNTEADYQGTSNPTGQNFLNDTFNSSRIQAGFALMNGPEYGVKSGWVQFPPIDMSLDPTQIILDARSKEVPQITNTQKDQFIIFLWELSKPALNAMGLTIPPRDTGIFNLLWKPSIGTPDFLGLVASWEISKDSNGNQLIDLNGNPVIIQVFSNKIAVWPTNGQKAYTL